MVRSKFLVRIGLLVLAVLVSLGNLNGTIPTLAQDCGTILFVSDRAPNQNRDIYSMTIVKGQGGTQRNLSNSPTGHDDNPSWISDGRIVFHTNRGSGHWEIYVMNKDGQRQQNLSKDPANWDCQPAWSSDGKRIAFASNRTPGHGFLDIYLMDDDGTNQRILHNKAADDLQPAWSPDGQKIAFTSLRDGNYEIYVMDISTKTLRNLTCNKARDCNPVWSPDSTLIAFQTDRDQNEEIYVMNSDGTQLRNLTRDAKDDCMPTWSPDGAYIAFQTNRDRNEEIYIMNAVDGSNQKNLTNTSGSNETNPAFSVSPKGTPPNLEIVSVNATNPYRAKITFKTTTGMDSFRFQVPKYTPPSPERGYASTTVVKEWITMNSIQPGTFEVEIDQRGLLKGSGTTVDTFLGAEGAKDGVTVVKGLSVTKSLKMYKKTEFDKCYLLLEGVGFAASHSKDLHVAYWKFTYRVCKLSVPASGKTNLLHSIVVHSHLSSLPNVDPRQVSVSYQAELRQGNNTQKLSMVETKDVAKYKALCKKLFGIDFKAGDSINYYLGPPIWFDANNAKVEAKAGGMAAIGAAGIGLSSISIDIK